MIGSGDFALRRSDFVWGKSGTATEFPAAQHRPDFRRGVGNSVAVPDFPE
jgi:hypothetical protein